ncbi:MAG: hypothetical protein PHG35_06985 [Dehalococcoidales bacterium]|nr:hypothetical protein [Dehalococcoidales bacterium]
MNESVLSQLSRLDLGRMKSYKELLDFYYGRQWEGKGRWHERRLTFNYARVFIEKVTSYLMGDINFAIDPYEDSDAARDVAKRAEAALKKVYHENHLEQLDLETETDCAVLGDGCYKVLWDAVEKRVRVTAPSGGDFTFSQPFLDKTDVHRAFFTEKFTGIESYSRPFWTHTLPGAHYYDGLWHEVVPFNHTNNYGLALAHDDDYAWLACPNGVWRAAFVGDDALDLTPDVISLRQEIDQTSGVLTVELNNDGGKYASPGEGAIAALARGCRLSFSPGYTTPDGDEYSAGQTYCLESIEHISAGGKALVILRARDGWGALGDWDARCQMRWNKASSDYSVKDIIAVILAKAGLMLEVISQSSVAAGFYPDFTVSPGDNGKAIVEKLLTFVPDVLFIEGNKAYLIDPQSTDASSYSYGADHAIHEGRYRQGALAAGRIQVEGYDTSQGELLVVDSFNWDEVSRLYDRVKHVDDRNLTTTAQGGQRGLALLRKAEIYAISGAVLVPVNCGQQLYDVIDVTDARGGLSEAKRRVLGMTLVYRPQRGEYLQRLELGGV